MVVDRVCGHRCREHGVRSAAAVGGGGNGDGIRAVVAAIVGLVGGSRNMKTVVAVLLVLCGVARADGQQLTLYGGETRYQFGDLGSNTSVLGGVAVAWPVTRFLRSDLTVLAFGYEGGSLVEGWTIRGTRMATEVGFYLQPRTGWVRPYAGAGAGISVSRRRFNDERMHFGRVSETLHAAVGSFIGMSREWGMRMELRVRGIVGPGVTSDLTVGISRRLAIE